MIKMKAHGKTSTLEVLGVSTLKVRPRKWNEQLKCLTALREEFLRGKSDQSRTAKEELTWFSEHMADAATDSIGVDTPEDLARVEELMKKEAVS